MPMSCARAVALATAAVLASAPALADVMVSTVPGGSSNVSGNRVFAVSWTQTAAYSGVSITADVFGVPAGGVAATAWLTTAIGPGSTNATQLATASISSDNLFSGLSLGAGTYYLVLMFNSGSNAAGATSTDSPVNTMAADVSLGSSFIGQFLDFPPYGPSASLAVWNQSLVFSVEGTRVGANVPEPWSLALVGVALAGLGASRRRVAPSA